MRKILFFIFPLSCLACQKKEMLPDNPYQFTKPEHFPEPTYTFDNNPITKEGFELGKKLFNDPRLSSDKSTACSNCHSKVVAFADPQHSLSIGVNNRVGKRNAPAIQNMAFMREFFWDGGVVHLDFVPPNAIENKLEMDEKMTNVVQFLNRDKEYTNLFRAAFGEIDSINTPMMLHAFSQYMNLLISDNSKYDQYLKGETELTTKELAGLKLFEQNCESCHSGVLFTNQAYANNGLDETFKDLGRALISEWEGDEGKFKIPSLRNVELTAPYMHDGRFETLEEVLLHYRNGVKKSATLAPELNNGEQLGIPLTAKEEEQIIVFLKTLTDRDFISNSIF
ncbi:MAG: cytochrome c peroxidase [Bacteroidota bacterium]